MPIFILSLLVQAGLVIHIIRTGRDNKWIYIVLIFPLVGSLAYFAIELLPDLRRSRTVRGADRAIRDRIDPHRHIRSHAEALDVADTIENKLNLGAALREKGHHAEALELYRAARVGLYASEPLLLLSEAETLYALQRFDEARATLETLREKNPDFDSADGHLLYAKVLEGGGQIAAAEHEYEALVRYYAGPEPKCRLAAILHSQGKHAAAQALYAEVLLAAKRNSRHYNRLHQEWVDLARRGAAPD